MRIVYIGAITFSYHCLEMIIENDGNVVGILQPRNRKNISDVKDMSPIADKYNIPLNEYADVNGVDTMQWIKELKPDIIFCLGISSLIKRDLLAVPSMGIIGIHPTELPLNRGRHPLIWALCLGLTESALTFFFMDEGADSGDILSQKRFNILEDDTSASLKEKVCICATEQIKEFMPKLIDGSYTKIKQNHNIASYWRKRSRRDGLIDWRMTSKAIYDLVRALTKPYPGAEMEYKGNTYQIWEMSIYKEPVNINIEPGKVIGSINNLPIIKTYDGAVILNKISPMIKLDVGEYIL